MIEYLSPKLAKSQKFKFLRSQRHKKILLLHGVNVLRGVGGEGHTSSPNTFFHILQDIEINWHKKGGEDLVFSEKGDWGQIG